MSYDVDFDRNTRRTVFFGNPCKNFTNGEDCKECKAAQGFFRQANQSQNPVDKAALKDKGRLLMAKSKIFINAINMKDEENDFPVRIYVLPPTVYDDIINQAKGLRNINKEINPFNPENGCRIVITREGQGIQTRYRVQIDQTTQPIPDMNILSRMHNLDNVEQLLQDNQQSFAILENGVNVLRVLPPWDDRKVLYKEVKFHRFGVDYVMEQQKAEGSQVPQGVATPPRAEDNFFAGQERPNIQDAAAGVDEFFNSFGASQSEAAITPNPNADIPAFDTPKPSDDRESQINDLLAQAEKLKEVEAGV